MLGDEEFENFRGRVSERRTPTPHAVAATNSHMPVHYMHDRGWDEPEIREFDLLKYWNIILKRKLIITVVFLISMACGLSATLMMTPIYTATTTLMIEREAARIVKADGVEPTEQVAGSEEFYQTQYGLLKSRSLAGRVADNLSLARNNDFIEQMGSSGEGIEQISARREKVVDLLQKNLIISPVRGSRLVALGFRSPDAQLSARVANAFAEGFRDSKMDQRLEASSYARDFLNQSLVEAKEKLEASEQARVAYAQRQEIINVGASENNAGQSLNVTSLVALNQALSTSRANRIAKEERWRQAEATDGRNLGEVLQNPTIQELAKRRAELAAEYSEKSQIMQPTFEPMRQLQAQIDTVDSETNQVINMIRSSLRSQYQSALGEERELQARVDDLKSEELDLQGRSVGYGILEREVEQNRSAYDDLLERAKEVGVASAVGTNNVFIVDPAQAPRRPTNPKPLLNMALAAILGLGLGGLLAFVLELLDESLTKPEDIETKLGLGLLGTVPTLEKGVIPINALNDPRSDFSEAYYSIRTALQFSTVHGAPSSLLVTSSGPAEGKSTTSLATAQNFARIGLRVLLVDCDLRNPSLHRTLGKENSQGLSNLLTGAGSLESMVQTTNAPNLFFLSTGPLPPNPAELLAGDGIKNLLAVAAANFNIVIMDGPPVMGFSDAPLLANAADGAMLVVEAGRTRRGQAKIAAKRLQLGHARIIGGVLTKFNARKSGYGYGYAYDYNYGDRPKINKSPS